MPTLKEDLIRIRTIVAEGEDCANKPGCIEDALSIVINGKDWWTWQREVRGTVDDDLPENAAEREAHAVFQADELYQALLAEANRPEPDYPWKTLWQWNDNHTKAERIALLDEVISQQ